MHSYASALFFEQWDMHDLRESKPPAKGYTAHKICNGTSGQDNTSTSGLHTET